MTAPSPTRVHIKDVRFNFAATLFTAKKGTDATSKEKYSVVAILPKNHPQIAEIKAAMAAAAKGKWGEAATDVPQGEGQPPLKLPAYQAMLKQLSAGDRLCLHDGDAKSDKPGYAGNLFINASNELRPLVLGPQREVLTAADGKPYSGSYGNIIIDFWPQDNKFGKRVNASLLGAQFVKDGERLAGGGVAAADDFEAIPEAAATVAAATGGGAKSLF